MLGLAHKTQMHVNSATPLLCHRTATAYGLMTAPYQPAWFGTTRRWRLGPSPARVGAAAILDGDTCRFTTGISETLTVLARRLNPSKPSTTQRGSLVGRAACDIGDPGGCAPALGIAEVWSLESDRLGNCCGRRRGTVETL